MTPKLIRIISARKGKGAPVAVVRGSASAPAKVTIPRMPVHPTMKRCEPRRQGITLPQTRTDQPRHDGDGRDPNQSHPDGGRADERRDKDEGSETIGGPHSEAAELQPDEDEDRAVEQEDEEIPDRSRLDPGHRRNDRTEISPHIQPSRDAGQHTGRMHLLRDDPRDIWCQEGDGDFGKAVLGEFQGLLARPATANPTAMPTAAANTKSRVSRRARTSTQDRSHGGTVQHESGSVVDQTLAFQDRDDTAGNL